MQPLPSPAPQRILVPSLLVALSAVLYGFLGYFGSRVASGNISIIEMQFWRFLVATLWLAIFAFRQIPARIPKRLLGSLFFLGTVSYAGGSEFYFVAAHYIGTGRAMVIFFSYPVMIALAAVLFHGQKMRLLTLFIMTVMLAGLFLLKGESTEIMNMGGIFLGIVSAAFYAFYLIISKRHSSTAISSSFASVIVCLGCTACFLILSLQSLPFVLPAGWKTWIHILLLGIISTALPIQLMLLGLQHISSLRASLISVLEPLISVTIGMVLLHENLSALQALGGIMVLGSALVIQFQKEL